MDNNKRTTGSHPGDFEVPVGAAVLSRDGEELGHVAEVSTGHFKVDAPNARDYWLSVSTIRRPGDGAVELTFDSEQIDDFKQESPEAAAGSPILDAGLDTFGSDEEQAERRARQARGYEASRRDDS